MILNVQPRPPEVAPELVAGLYEWESFRPEGDWLGREILVPRDSPVPPRRRALGSLFQAVPNGRPLQLQFAADGRRTVRPRLVYLRDREGPLPLTLSVDGAPVYSGRVRSRRGIIELPALPPGGHAIKVDAGGSGRFLINHAAPRGRLWIKRLASRLRPGRVSFFYRKTTTNDEVLSLRFHPRYGHRERLRLEVAIRARPGHAGPHPYLTLTNRVYDIRVDNTEALPVLGTRNEYVSAGHPFFVRLGSDIPPGRYRVDVRLVDGPAGYVVMSKTTPGERARRTIYSEAAAGNG